MGSLLKNQPAGGGGKVVVRMPFFHHFNENEHGRDASRAEMADCHEGRPKHRIGFKIT